MWDVLLQEIMCNENVQIFNNFVAKEKDINRKASAKSNSSPSRRRLNTAHYSIPVESFAGGDRSRSSSLEVDPPARPDDARIMSTPATPTSRTSKFVRKAKLTNSFQYEKVNKSIDDNLDSIP